MATGGVSFNLAPMVRLVHRSYQLIGLCPYKLPTDINSDRFAVSRLTAIYSAVLAFASALCLPFHFLWSDAGDVSRSNLPDFTMRFMLIGGVSFHLLNITYTLMSRHRTWQFLRDINNVDRKLQSLGVQFNYARQYWFVQLFTMFWISFVVGMFAIHCYNNLHAFTSVNTFFTRIISDILAVYNFGAIMSQFFFCLMLIYSRFVCLNAAFRRSLLHNDAPKNVDYVVTQFRVIHDILTDAVSKINSLLSLMVTSNVSVSLFFAVLTLNALYKKFMLGIDPDLQYSSYYYWVAYFTSMSLINIILASVLLTEGASTAVLVNKAMNRSVLVSNTRHLRLFSQQLRIRAPIVTCWLYNYDWELIYTMCGTVSMYTLIFIQFDILAAQNQQTNSTRAAQ